MKIQSLKMAFFSPTGTTKSIIQGIARGINHSNAELIDITKPDARKRPLRTKENELLVVAVPVYMGRVPALLIEWLHTIEARNTPVVCVVVYGNREYDDALLELTDILTERGCKLVAGAVFIGEHSFSSAETPTAHGRPNENDLDQATLFGRKVNEKVLSLPAADDMAEIDIPGQHPYGGNTKIWCVDFIAVSDACAQCGLCAQVCPVDAIDSENSNLIDHERCITCCACIKNCPQNARTMKPGVVREAAVRLNKMCKEPKSPVFFL